VCRRSQRIPLFVTLAGVGRVGERLRGALLAEGGQGPILGFTEGLDEAEFVELAAEPIGGTRHAQMPIRIVIPSARCRPNADHYPSDAAGDALDEQL
jgi:hypothetical protein